MKKYLAEYARSFAAAGFNRHKDLYIASGLLSYNASKEMTDMLKFLEPHSRTVQYKEMYLPPEMLHTLNPEQQALVDFLVLANSDNFVGLGSSTFSVYLRWVCMRGTQPVVMLGSGCSMGVAMATCWIAARVHAVTWLQQHL